MDRISKHTLPGQDLFVVTVKNLLGSALVPITFVSLDSFAEIIVGLSLHAKTFSNTGGSPLHEPNKRFSLNGTGSHSIRFSRGRIDPNLGVKATEENQIEDLSAYDVREFFDFKFSNSLPVLTIQTLKMKLYDEQKIVTRYHYKLAKLNVDLLIESQ